MMTGGRIAGFRQGWAKAISFGGSEVAHYFRREGAGLAVSSCRGMVCGAGRLLHIGSWVACKRCVARHGEPSAAERDVGRLR